MKTTNRLPHAPTKPLPELTEFLKPFQVHFARSQGRHALDRYLTGLLTEPPNQNCNTRAEIVPGTTEQRLQGLLTTTAWDEEDLHDQRIERMLEQPSEGDAVLIFDDTGFPNPGKCSVGVARQDSGTLGKLGNCQITVNCHYAERTCAWPVATRLYLPEDWAQDAARREKARGPKEITVPTQPAIALDLLDQANALGVRWRCVTCGADYGDNPNFLAGLEKRRERSIVAVRCDFAVALSRRGGAARRADAVIASMPARSGRTVAWREGSQGWLRGRLVAVRTFRVSSSGRRKVGGRIGEGTAEGKLKYYGSNFGPKVPLDRWVEYAHRRHWVERYHQEAKGLLGWDQDQRRLWPGCHRHAVRVMLAYSFLVWREWPHRQQQTRPGRRRRARSPRPDRRRVPLPEVHRQIVDWLRRQAAKEVLLRELMTVPERIPA